MDVYQIRTNKNIPLFPFAIKALSELRILNGSNIRVKLANNILI